MGRPSDRSACASTVSYLAGAKVEWPRTDREKHRKASPVARSNSESANVVKVAVSCQSVKSFILSAWNYDGDRVTECLRERVRTIAPDNRPKNYGAVRKPGHEEVQISSR